jgi:hypothetical protein
MQATTGKCSLRLRKQSFWIFGPSEAFCRFNWSISIEVVSVVGSFFTDFVTKREPERGEEESTSVGMNGSNINYSPDIEP